jgi:hypothetical protein
MLEKENIKPEAELLYFGRKSEATEKEMVKFPTAAIPNINIRIFFTRRLSNIKIPGSRKNPMTKLKSNIFLSLKYLRRKFLINIPTRRATPYIARKTELVFTLTSILSK